MGWFSWGKSKALAVDDTDNRIKVKLIDNQGHEWLEYNYQGDGIFDGKDYFELMAVMNGYDPSHKIGVGLEFGDRCQSYLQPEIVNINSVRKWQDLRGKYMCVDHGFYIYLNAGKLSKVVFVKDRIKLPTPDRLRL